MKPVLLALLASLLLSSPGLADACRRPAGGAERAAPSGRDCPPESRLVPYEPPVRQGESGPGFVDLGNGTEVRIGGRVRVDYDARR